MGRVALRNTHGQELVGQTMVRRKIKKGSYIHPDWKVEDGDFELVDDNGPFHGTPTAEPDMVNESFEKDDSEPEGDGGPTVVQPSTLKGDELMARAKELDIPRRTVMGEPALQQAVADVEAKYARDDAARSAEGASQ